MVVGVRRGAFHAVFEDAFLDDAAVDVRVRRHVGRGRVGDAAGEDIHAEGVGWRVVDAVVLVDVRLLRAAGVRYGGYAAVVVVGGGKRTAPPTEVSGAVPVLYHSIASLTTHLFSLFQLLGAK